MLWTVLSQHSIPISNGSANTLALPTWRSVGGLSTSPSDFCYAGKTLTTPSSGALRRHRVEIEIARGSCITCIRGTTRCPQRNPPRRTRPLLDAAQLILRNAPRAGRETAVLYQQTGTPRGLALSADNNLLLSHSLNAKKVALFD